MAHKLMGIAKEKAADAAAYALAKCQATRFRVVDTAKYEAVFVPAFMARLGIEDVEKVPARSTLDLVYRSHVAEQEEEKKKAESETYRQKTSSSRRRLAPVTKSPKDELAESMAPVRDAMKEAKIALLKASRDKNKTGQALRRLGFRGDGVLDGGTRFTYDDIAYATRVAKRGLPDEHGLDFSRMTTAREVWIALFKYYEGLGDSVLKERIAATRERCDEASFERHSTKPQNAHTSLARAAFGRVRQMRVAEEQEEDVEADLDLIACGVFLSDGLGAKPGTARPFGRVLEPLVPMQLPSYVAPREEPETFYGVDSATDQRLAVNSGGLVAKLAMGAGKYDIGIGLNQDQKPVATILRPLGVAAVATLGAWCGLELPDQSGRKFSHRGRETLASILIDVYKPARVWAVGDDYDWKVAMPPMGLRVDSSEVVQTQEYGPLEGFERVCFASGGIPGGLEALDGDRLRLASRMRDAVAAQGDNAGSVRLGPCVLEKLNPSKPAADSNFRLFVCGPNRKTGEIRPATRVTLDYLRRENYAALHYVAERAALLGNVKLRLLAYAHAGSGRFHFDGVGGPQKSKRMAAAARARDPANLDSLNFSLASGPKKARMGPALG